MKRALKGQPSLPFKRPSGLKFKKMNLDTGEPTSLHDKNAIMEGFKPEFEASPDQPAQIAIGKPGYKLNLPARHLSSDPTFFQSLETMLTGQKEAPTETPPIVLEAPKESISEDETFSLPEDFLDETPSEEQDETSSEEIEEVPFNLPTSSETPYNTAPLDLTPAPPPLPPVSQDRSETAGTGGLF